MGDSRWGVRFASILEVVFLELGAGFFFSGEEAEVDALAFVVDEGKPGFRAMRAEENSFMPVAVRDVGH